MSIHKPCDECTTVRRCRMFIDATTHTPIYLCRACARALGYAALDEREQASR